MAKRRGKKRTYKRRRRVANPTRARKVARRISRGLGRSLMGLNFKSALASVPYMQIGMFAAKIAAKRLGPDASETDPGTWNWSSYLKGSLGGAAAAIAVNAVKRGGGQKVLEGALNLMFFKAIENELVATSDWAKKWFGEDDYVPNEYLMTGTDQDPWMYADDGSLMPADDRHRLPEVPMGQLEPIGPLGQLEPVGPLGAVDPWVRAYSL